MKKMKFENLMINGFADQDLIAGLNGLIGN